ncbi:MAG TPA: hypothetical protein VEF05_14305 [Terriglobales bacterium]|nr:hypothetical protein [Terriglobales bacterium]
MLRGAIKLLLVCVFVSTLFAQDFKVFDRDVQVHGFASQGFIHTNDNNWLTMNTANVGSGQFTDFGVNASAQITDKFRIGAQLYDRELGQLGKWHPELDWAVASYKFSPWFGIRGGKVKTVMGLYNDTQDLDFLHTFALLPQSVYPTDLRDVTIAHEGGDIFGDIPANKKFGTFSYTAYAGHRDDSHYSGFAYLINNQGGAFNSFGGLQYGGDLRWATPLKGLLVGVSRMNEDITLDFSTGGVNAVRASSKSDFTNQFYGQYSWNKLLLDAEYRRYWTDLGVQGISVIQEDVRGWYVAGSYRITKRLQVGSYYSHYSTNYLISALDPAGTGHDYDKVITGRFDPTRFMSIKIEGHFMDGYGLPNEYPNGFYSANNPQGLKPNTNALVVKTDFKF